MMRTFKIIYISLLLMFTTQSYSNISLPAVFSDNMVLQRNAEVKIWGWAKPTEEVKLQVSWSREIISTTANENGTWELIIKTTNDKGPQEIKISGYNEVVLSNVLLGEVWLVSGQSNMEWSAASGIENAEEAIAGAENPEIRFFQVAHRTADDPQQDLDGSWVSSTPETMKHFSAVAYFFGKKLNEELDVPIGLINSSWGGTPAEVWMPEELFKNNLKLKEAASLLPEEPWGPREPGRLYNAMIAPLTSFKLAGILWYQGESNTHNADYYELVFTNLIQSWREIWEEELPFFYAQIAPYDYGEGDSGVKVRDAQRRVLKVPNTAMVLTSDIGNIKDIHPQNKLDVGLRFANIALDVVYDQPSESAYAPTFDRVEKDGKQLNIYFDNAEGLQIDPQNKESQFEVAGEDRQFHPATAKIKNGVVTLRAKQVKEPQFVRFSWGNMSTSNLFNEAGLPASSFTTEN
jgi:sialate O-acetylesterase